MGWISNFLSDSVLTGFIFGIGISIVISQMHNITGTTESGANAWLRVASWVQGFPGTSLPTLALGLSTLIFLVVLRLYMPKFPGALLAMALGIGAELLFQLSDYGVATLDPVARGLPVFTLPDQNLILGNLGVVIPAAVSVFFVAMSASLAAAREYASEYHYDIDINQELLAQGAANTANGLFQGMGVYGYIGGTNMSVASGGRTEVPSLVLGVLTILTMLFFAPIFSYLPLAVLGAVLIEVVYFGLWKIPQMTRLWKIARTEFWLALAAMLGVLTFGILEGMLIGVALSLLWLIWRTSHPAVPELGKMPHSLVYHSLSRYPDSETHPGIIIVRFDGPIFFATASRLRENIRGKITDSGLEVKAVILDMESTNIIDLEGSAALHQVAKELKSAGIDFHLVRTKSEIIEVLSQDGVLDTIGRDNLLDYVHEAVDIINARMKKGG
jgi:MFS superfamily sulfate permease-like transporter